MTPPKVLLVEDNPLLREWLSNGLNCCGLDVSAVGTAEEAARVAGHDSIDALITDWSLPEGADGLEVLSLVREKCPYVPAVLMSADLNPELRKRAASAGFDAVFQKPLPPWKIAATLQSLLGALKMEVV